MYSTIDTHVAGEAFRIVIHSPIILDEDRLELNDERLQQHYQHEIGILLNEPRGHRDMNGCIILPSTVADYALLFLPSEDREHFTHSGLVATITALVETGTIQEKQDGMYIIETTHGIYDVRVTTEQEEVTAVYVESDPCFVKKDSHVTFVSEYQERNYFIFHLPEHIPAIEVDYLTEIHQWGREAVAQLLKKEQHFSGVILINSPDENPHAVQSVTFREDGTILRSPGFDTTCSILASIRSKNHGITELNNTSIFGSSFTARTIEHDNDRFSITTEGFVTGSHEFIVDQDDPFPSGFILK